MKATQTRRLCVAFLRSSRMKRGENSPRIFEGSPLNERLIDFVSVIFRRARHREANGVHSLAGFFSFPANPTQNSETEYCSLWGRHGKGREQWAFEKKSSPISSVLA